LKSESTVLQFSKSNAKHTGPFRVDSQEVVSAPSFPEILFKLSLFLKFYSNCHYPIWWTSAKL